eukprot:scaffold347_cov215-Ochromonas_danica.AAC.1
MAYKEEVARRIDLERKLEESQAASAHLNANHLKAIEGKTTDTLALNDNLLLSQSQEDEIAVLLQNCSTNLQQMIESGDVTVLKTLETYNAIHRIPVSLINHHFTMTVDGIEFKAGEMSVYSSTMLPWILIEMDMTALHMAAVKGNIEMIRLLLLHPAIDVNALNCEEGWTPLHVACYYGCFEVVMVLLLAEQEGWTPLHCACYNGQVDVVKVLLLDKRVDVNKPNNLIYGTVFNQVGVTSLLTACVSGHVEVVRMLLFDERVDLNRPDNGEDDRIDVKNKKK